MYSHALYLCFRMSLQFDPDFVADQVVILEAGLQEMGQRFLATSQKIGSLNTVLADKNAQLRSALCWEVSLWHKRAGVTPWYQKMDQWEWTRLIGCSFQFDAREDNFPGLSALRPQDNHWQVSSSPGWRSSQHVPPGHRRPHLHHHQHRHLRCPSLSGIMKNQFLNRISYYHPLSTRHGGGSGWC